MRNHDAAGVGGVLIEASKLVKTLVIIKEYAEHVKPESLEKAEAMLKLIEMTAEFAVEEYEETAKASEKAKAAEKAEAGKAASAG